jgi:hypothetical protein
MARVYLADAIMHLYLVYMAVACKARASVCQRGPGRMITMPS